MTEVYDNADHKYSYEGISLFCCDFALLFEFYLLPCDLNGCVESDCHKNVLKNTHSRFSPFVVFGI